MTPLSTSQQTWFEIYQRFDPMTSPGEAAAAAQGRKSPDGSQGEVSGSTWRVKRTYNRGVPDILEDLRNPHNKRPHLLFGTIGTGKTTELRYIAQCCRDHPAPEARKFVVYFDLISYVNSHVDGEALLLKLSDWELCLLIGLALVGAAQERFAAQPEQWLTALQTMKDAWKTAAAATDAPDPDKIDIASVAKGLFKLACELTLPPMLGKIADTVATGVHKRLDLQLGQTRRPAQNAVVQGLLAAVNTICFDISHATGQTILLIMDGLDRIHDEKKALALLKSSLLTKLNCQMILSGPYALQHDILDVPEGSYTPHYLLNEPVLDKQHPDDPQHQGVGVDTLVQLYRVRVSDLEATALFPDGLLRKLAYYSGGSTRAFIKLVRDVANKCGIRDLTCVTMALIDEILTDQRIRMESGLLGNHKALLRSIQAKRDLPGADSLLLTNKLLANNYVLPYPNDSHWFYPHPLLSLGILKPEAP